jgi:hypothetical protein
MTAEERDRYHRRETADHREGLERLDARKAEDEAAALEGDHNPEGGDQCL